MMRKNHIAKGDTTFFRFYAELNDFLPHNMQKVEFPHEFTGNPSIKDTIEAIGVPHTEIDIILVNGKSVGFDYKMQGGEKVSVYPVFESFDITPLLHLRPKPLRETKFITDINLGGLARKFRLLGFDTLFKNDYTDREIIEISLREKRILLTRAKSILKYKGVIHGFWIRNENPVEQVKEVVTRLQLENSFQPFARCSSCNGEVHAADKEQVQSRVPNKSCQVFDIFKECKECGKIYWQGSHYEHICQWIEGLKCK